MVYVGTGLHSVDSEWSIEPSLIDPKQRVARSISNDVNREIPHYWQTYDSVDPVTRRAYLEWLAAGRRDSNAAMPLVWMFFYGLERRLLDDLKGAWHTDPEVNLLDREIRELASTYERDSSFHGHATRLLEVLDAGRGRIEPWRASNVDWDLPLGLRLELGKHAANGSPIDADLALHWAVHHPEIYLRTPALRCRAQFDELFRQMYERRQAPITPKGSREITLTYYPATPSMYNVEPIKLPGSLDVASDGRARAALKRIVTRATDEVDALSRWMGRDHAARDSLTMLAVYPKGVAFDEAAQQCILRFEESIGDSSALTTPRLVSAGTFAEHFPVKNTAKPTPKDLQAISAALARLSIGMIPDAALGERWTAGHEPVLYSNVDAAKRASQAQQRSREVAVVLGSLAGQLIQVSPGERDRLVDALAQELRSNVRAHPSIARMSTARALYMSQGKLTTARLRKLVDSLDDKLARELSSSLVNIVARAGAMTPDCIHRLDELGAALGVESTEIHRMMHAATSGTLAVNYSTTGLPQKSKSEPTGTAQTLDTRATERLMRESRRLTAQLDAILGDDSAPEPVDSLPRAASSEAEKATPGDREIGLDAPLVGIVRAVVGLERVSREQFAELARLADVFPDAAIETINEWALDVAGDILLDGDDDLEVHEDIAEELSSKI
jgi:hypothetical protein